VKRTHVLRSTALFFFLLFLFSAFSACGEKPAESLPESGPSAPDSAPESEPETASESEPATARERMEKLVRDEYESLRAELAAEKETDPIFDDAREADPALVEELRETEAKMRRVKYALSVIEEGSEPGECEASATYAALVNKSQELSLRAEELRILTLSSGTSLTREKARIDYPHYAYFKRPGHPNSPFFDLEHRHFAFSSIESVASRAMPTLFNLAPTKDDQTAFTARCMAVIPDGYSYAVVAEVTEVFWGSVAEGDRVALHVDGEEIAGTVLEGGNWLVFSWTGEESVAYEEEKLPRFFLWAEDGYQIREDGTLWAATGYKEFHKLEGLAPEEACELVLRTYMKYGDAAEDPKPLAIS